jgi:hypothetical protein
VLPTRDSLDEVHGGFAGEAGSITRHLIGCRHPRLTRRRFQHAARRPCTVTGTHVDEISQAHTSYPRFVQLIRGVHCVSR